MRFTSPSARTHFERFVEVLSGAVVALDFDGTLAPVVEDPAAARILPGAGEALVGLAPAVGALGIITGRPARQVVSLGGLDTLEADVFVFGQYGNERWSSALRRIVSPRPPSGLATFERSLPVTLAAADAADAFIEEKGLAVAIHTRRMAEPEAAYERLLGPLTELAHEHGLVVEPGRHVIEVRSGHMDKGMALRTLVSEQEATGVLFAGDDLGDVEAFEAVRHLRDGDGLPGVVVCSSSAEQPDLVELADIVVDGPHGVVELLLHLADPT